MSDDQEVIRVVRPDEGGDDGHHGGSWKVAYADFVTAMMAFFLVMWIVGMDQEARELIQGYFNDPIGYKEAYGSGDSPVMDGQSPSAMRRAGGVGLTGKDRQRRRFEEVGERIKEKLESSPELADLAENIRIVVTEEGLRIEIAETADGETFFDLASAELKPAARKSLSLIAPELGRLENPVVLEGHTDARPLRRKGYSNWELSNDRANAARRALVSAGLRPARIREVRGYADRELREPDRPMAPANRRVSILLPFQESRARPLSTPLDTTVRSRRSRAARDSS